MYVVICNFPMGKAIVDYMDHTDIELDETTVFHLDGILLEREIKQKVLELNDLERDVAKHLDYYISAILADDLDKVRYWEKNSPEAAVYCVFEMTSLQWNALVEGKQVDLTEQKAAVEKAFRL